MNTPLRQLVETRLNSDDKVEDEWGLLVLAALAGSDALQRELGQKATEPEDTPKQPVDAPTTGARSAFLKAIAVEGFRGIGPKATLDIPPGPGLTLVVGRNGSGKSSFAEGLELLLTGDTYRWSQRSKVWRDGWRNLHHPKAALAAEFALEGETPGTTRGQPGSSLGASFVSHTLYLVAPSQATGGSQPSNRGSGLRGSPRLSARLGVDQDATVPPVAGDAFRRARMRSWSRGCVEKYSPRSSCSGVCRARDSRARTPPSGWKPAAISNRTASRSASSSWSRE